MDPKLRPSFQDIVRHLEEVLVQLKVEDMQHACVALSGEADKKMIPKGTTAAPSSGGLTLHLFDGKW